MRKKYYINVFFGYLSLLFALGAGVGILALSEKIHILTIPSSVIIFCMFVLLNLTFSHFLRLNNDIAEYWSIKKALYLPFAVMAGGCISLLPPAIAILIGKAEFKDIKFTPNFSLIGICLTFIIVTWEELWFRGIFLSYCNRYLSAINLSITIGFLFMALHALNPEIDLFKKGPALFGAGALLSILYFNFKSLWVPIGLHFGNNYAGNMLKNKYSTDIFWGDNGNLSAIILCLSFIFFAIKMKRAKNDHNHFIS